MIVVEDMYFRTKLRKKFNWLMRADHEPKEDVFTMGFKNEHTMALFSTSKELNNMKIQEYLYLI